MATTYQPYPTLTRFHNDYHLFMRFLAGPPGSGKSVGSFMELFAIALRQEPTPDKVRDTRFAVIRSTYGELEETTLETMKTWLPAKYTKVVKTKPIKVRTVMPLPDGTVADIKFRLIAIEKVGDLGKLDSAEYTAIWLNELTGLPSEVVGKAGERVGRYPPNNLWDDGGYHVTQYCVIGDYNYPSKDHWLVPYLHEGDMPENTQLYEQPPALLDHVDPETKEVTYELNPMAENLANLDGGNKYLKDLSNYLSLNKKDMITTRLLCRYGKAGGDGKAVVTNFEKERHESKEKIVPKHHTRTMISIDTSGVHPCALFWQMYRGDWTITDGVYGEGMGLEEFIDDVITPMITIDYPGCDILFVCDPANARDSRTATSPTDLIIQRGYRAVVAPTNRFKERSQAVETMLGRREKGRVVISKHVTILIDALDGAYQYKVLNVVGSEKRYASQPLKNKYSHWADAFQYGCLHIVANTVDTETVDRAKKLARTSSRRAGRK